MFWGCDEKVGVIINKANSVLGIVQTGMESKMVRLDLCHIWNIVYCSGVLSQEGYCSNGKGAENDNQKN